MTTRLAIPLALVLAVTGCTKHPATSTSAGLNELQLLIGQRITVTGEFRLPGKLGPYISTPRGQIYVLPSSFASKHFKQMDSRRISATGVLQHQHYERPPTQQPADAAVVAPPQDHYYFQAESIRIELLRP